ncbi:MFS transporter [Streptomyces sp. NPDC052107]|uniref:MFS transporter n=1 Tax=Streptomyces sp. NPDC052107 TaxID=3155632 RepID=UPI003416EB84
MLLSGTLVFSLGRGMYMAGSVVLFSRKMGLTADQIGIVLSVAGVSGFLAAVPVGRLGDRFGARRTALSVQLVEACTMLLLLRTNSYPILLCLAVVIGAADRGTQITRQMLVTLVATPQSRVRLLALMRSAFNVGAAVGALVVAPVLAVDRHAFYDLLLITISLCYFGVSLTTRKLPRTPVGTTQEPPSKERDRVPLAYLAVGLVNGVLMLHVSVLNIAIPLWLIQQTSAPRAAISFLLVVNTVMAVLLQVRVSRSADTVDGAARTLAVSSVFCAVACAVFSGTRLLNGLVLLLALALGAALLTLGELAQQSGAWGVSFGLAPVAQQGRYLGVFSFGGSLQDIAGPAVVTAVVIGFAPAGWWILAALFVTGGLLVMPLTRYAIRSAACRSDADEEVTV